MIPENTNTPLKADCPSAPCSPSFFEETETARHAKQGWEWNYTKMDFVPSGSVVGTDISNRLESERNQNRKLYETEQKDHNFTRKILDRVINERDELKSLVGTIRSMLPIPARNVDDITPPQHSYEICNAIELLTENSQTDRPQGSV